MQDKTPFIQLLESPNAKYFFDVNKNEIIPVSEKTYEVLRQITKNQAVILEDEVKREIEELESMGYLSDHRVKVIRHPASDQLDTYTTRKLEKITLQVTQSCNLRCDYCIYSDIKNRKQRTHSAKRMSFEVARKGVDFLLEHSIDSDEINIGFYGGEPLLEFNLIKKIVAYVEEAAVCRNFTFNITTNCTLVTEEIIRYFIKHKIKMMISLDGPKEIHDKNRRFAFEDSGSFDKIMETLKWIHEKYPDYIEEMMISMVIDPQNGFDYINTIFKEYEFLKKLILITSIIDDTYSEEKISFSEEFIVEHEYRLFLGFLNHFDRLEADCVSTLVKKEVERIEYNEEKFEPFECLPDQSVPSGPCIPGQLRLFMNTDGNFFPCERVNEVSEVMSIGNVEDGFFIDKVDALLNIGSLTAGKCRNCPAFVRCSLCAKHSDEGNELSGDLKLEYCNRVRRDFEDYLRYKILFQEFQEVYQ